MECASNELKELLKNCKSKSVNIKKIPIVENFLNDNKQLTRKKEKWLKILFVLCLLTYGGNYYFNELQSKRCSFEMPRLFRYVFRPPENCNFCENVNQIVRVRDITPQEFTQKYAYTATPVIVEDATQNWTALEKFNYWYFRDIYNNAKRTQKILDCQFLPYQTGFRDIFEALAMPPQRVNYFNHTDQEPKQPWYFGWSNCNPETAEEFRRHYGRPYFLPETSENNAVDWFFIGTAGLGAHMHIDNVRLPSWQAQLAGSKRWLLAPPPECYFKCKSFDAVVKKGDIIVLDTNKWYHQTFVQPGEISLTIGAEYD